MTTTEFWPQLAAPLLNGIALLLALGFRRNRAVMVLLILSLASLALADVAHPARGERAAEAIRMFAPWLLLAAAAMPERRLLARRNLFLLVLLALSTGLILKAPAQVWQGLCDALPFGWLPWSAGAVAAAIALMAALLCLGRWLVQRAPMDSALGMVLVVVGIALLPAMRPGATSDLLALAGAMALIAILYTSYRMAFVDGLAGLPNRRALDEALARLSGDCAVAMVDVDHFKAFNDRHGHGAGDRVLKSVAGQLRATRGASAYRYGGEEFCLLFTGSRVGQARESCEELRQRIAQMRVQVRSMPAGKRVRKPGRKTPAAIGITVSIGLAQRSERLRGPAEILKAADQALYRAKARGRNRVIAC